MFQPTLLTDLTRLPEIYRLRALCWEHSPNGHLLNTATHPNGMKDFVDEDSASVHFIIEAAGTIIAAVRLAQFRQRADLERLIPEYKNIHLPAETPIAHYGRLVVHPDYRGKGLVHLLDEASMNWFYQSEAAYLLGEAPKMRSDKLLKLGFTHLQDFPYSLTTKNVDVPSASYLCLNPSQKP